MSRAGLPETFLDSEPIRLFREFKNIADQALMHTRIGQDLLSPKEILYYAENPGIKTGPSGEHPIAINIHDLVRGIHKFSNCCQPYPGQASVVAALSERGVAFHRKECRDLSTRHGLGPEKLLRVNWDFDSPWQTPLKFDVHIRGKSLAATIVLLNLIPKGLEILQVESTRNRRNLPGTLIYLKLKSFSEARDFFACFKTTATVIKGYGREQYRP